MPTLKPAKVDLTAARTFAAANLPGAEVKAKFGGASFFIGGKVFAFTSPKGLVLKLPQKSIASLLETSKAQHLTMGKRVMREWVVLPLTTPDVSVDHLLHLKSSMAFVQSLEQR